MPRDAWNQDHFGNTVGNPALESSVWGGSANPDGDAADNDTEYAFAGDPNTSNDPGALTVASDGLGNKELTYIRRSNDPNLVFRLQSSPDLSAWADFTGVLIGEITTSLDAESERMALLVQVHAGFPMMCYRIVAEQQQ